MYNVLAIEGQIYLPPIAHCPMDFIKQIMSGRKKVSLAVQMAHGINPM